MGQLCSSRSSQNLASICTYLSSWVCKTLCIRVPNKSYFVQENTAWNVDMFLDNALGDLLFLYLITLKAFPLSSSVSTLGVTHSLLGQLTVSWDFQLLDKCSSRDSSAERCWSAPYRKLQLPFEFPLEKECSNRFYKRKVHIISDFEHQCRLLFIPQYYLAKYN